MRGGIRVIVLAMAVLLLLVTVVPAGEYMLPLAKTVSPGHTFVRFDGTAYHITTQGNYLLIFTKIDIRHTSLFIKPKPGEPVPFEELVIQWDPFPAQILGIGSSGGDTYILDSETGYAEK